MIMKHFNVLLVKELLTQKIKNGIKIFKVKFQKKSKNKFKSMQNNILKIFYFFCQ